MKIDVTMALLLGVLFAQAIVNTLVGMLYAQTRELKMALEELKSAIEHATSVQAGAVVLIRELAEKINQLAQNPNPEQLRQLAHELRAKSDELAGAIAELEEGDEGETPPDPQSTRRR